MKIRKLSAEMTLLASIATLAAAQIHANPTYLGVGQFSELASDDSGLTNKLYLYPSDQLNDAPFGFQVLAGNRAGSFGSGIATTNRAGTYIMLADRGPIDGQVSSVAPVKNGPNSLGVTGYVDRFYTNTIRVVADVSSKTGYRIDTQIGHTTLLSNPDNGLYYNGLSSAFDNGTRLDPEAVRVANDGRSIWTTDEYGPYLIQFDIRTGEKLSQISFPAKFIALHPAAEGDVEDSNSYADYVANPLLGGRLSNKGAEGLALSSDGKKAFSLMQGPITQDGGSNGSYARLVQFDLESGQTKEYVYKLDSSKNGTHELIAVDDHRFLVIESNGKGMEGAKGGGVKGYVNPGTQKIYLIDIAAASDVSSISDLSKGLPAGAVAVSKQLFLDLLAAVPHDSFTEFNTKNPDSPWLEKFTPDANGPGQNKYTSLIPSKIEGLAWGDDFVNPQGKLQHVLLVTTDNDLVTDGIPNGSEPFQEGGINGVTGEVYPEVDQHGIPGYVMAFAFSDADLPGLMKQNLIKLGDFNADGVIDKSDVALLNSHLNESVSATNATFDLNQDGVINAVDARQLVTLCTKTRCQ